MGKELNLIKQKFGRLIVIKNAGYDKWRSLYWLCECNCGNIIKVRQSSLKSGHTKSCGCLQKDIVTNLKLKHGHSRNGYTTKTYSVWLSMHDRCRNPKNRNYKYYGGRGINVCQRWLEFKNFLKDMGEAPAGLSIERENNDGNYESNNCSWVNWKRQGRNKSNNKLTKLKVQVIKKLLAESSLTQEDIARIFIVSPMTISNINTEKTWGDINY